MGDNRPQSGLRLHDAMINTADEMMMKTIASPRLIAPRGISRMAVRGLSASKRASTRRLNPMAALRAATIATTIQATRVHVNGCVRDARGAPVSANGSAKIECEKRTNEK